MFVSRFSICVSAALVFAFGAVPSRAASCTNASLHGNYAFTANGVTLPALGLPAPLTGPFASSGTATFDGNGNFSLTAVSSFNGAVGAPATVTGTYSVSSDRSYTSQGTNGATFRGAIVSGGRELLILQTNTGTVITGVALKRGGAPMTDEPTANNAPRCNNTAVAGSYGFLAQGYAGDPILPGAPFAPLAGVGVLTLNADGSFTMMAQRSVNGTLDPEPLPLTGTFTVAQDCSAQLTFDVGFHFDAQIVNRQESLFIETDQGSALTVKAKRL